MRCSCWPRAAAAKKRLPRPPWRLRARLNEAAEAQGLKKQIRVLPTGCLDACGCGPAVLDSASQTLYVDVGKDDAADIVRKTARRHGLKP